MVRLRSDKLSTLFVLNDVNAIFFVFLYKKHSLDFIARKISSMRMLEKIVVIY